MTLEWLIPIRTFVIALYCGTCFLTGTSAGVFGLGYGQGWGWVIISFLSGAIVGLILLEAWEWLDDLIQEAENEPA